MLRQSRPEDMEEIVEIWLLASQAHDFVDASCWWQAQEDLRTRYLDHAPASGCSRSAAICSASWPWWMTTCCPLFVPRQAGAGVGHALLQEAKSRCAALHTRVFVENEPAVHFYRRHGFRIGEEVWIH